MKPATQQKVWKIFNSSVRLYFAPLTGAIRGVRREIRRLDRADAQKTSFIR